jgi:hypothetical protein
MRSHRGVRFSIDRAAKQSPNPATSVVIAIADAMLANETSLRSRTPGTKNVKMMTVSGHTRAPLWSPETKAVGRPQPTKAAGICEGQPQARSVRF